MTRSIAHGIYILACSALIVALALVVGLALFVAVLYFLGAVGEVLL